MKPLRIVRMYNHYTTCAGKEAPRSGAVKPLRIVRMYNHYTTCAGKEAAAPAAFTFQAGGPGIIPAQRGEAVRPLRIVRMYNHYTTMRKKENPLCPGNFSQKDFPVQRGLCVLLIWSELTALSFRSYCRSLHSMQRTPPVSDKAVRL